MNEPFLRRLVSAGLAVLFLVIARCGMSAAAAEYPLHVILPLTGNAAFTGKGQQQIFQLLEASANAAGGIDGRQLSFIFHDDQSSPQVAVQLAAEVLSSHPAVIIGSSLTAMCNAMAPLVQNGPVMYCLSPGIRPAPGSYIFSATVPTQGEVETLVRYLRLQGFDRLATLMSTDATGQDADLSIDNILRLPENASLRVVERLHFNPTDLSVTAQIERIKASDAQALIAWTTGAQLVTVLKGITQAGLEVPVGTSAGNMHYEAFKQFVPFLPKQLVMPTPWYPEHDGLFKLDPRIETAQHVMYASLQGANLRADDAVATAWDPGLIILAAVRKLGSGATAAGIRDYISHLTDFPGIDGIYNFQKVPQRGLDANDCVVVRYDPGRKQWVWMSGPAGTRLEP